jgi:hypothetical protein
MRFVVSCSFILGGCSLLVDTDPGPDPSIGDGGVRNDSGVVDRDGGREDGGGGCPSGCDDGIACTVDSCMGTACDNEPIDSLCSMGERCQEGVGCVPVLCTEDAQCDNGRMCDGEERCRPGDPGSDPRTGCAAGDPPRCDDETDCTTDSCDEARGCVFEPNDALCSDGIDCTTDRCESGRGESGCVFEPDDSLCGSFCVTGVCSPSDGGCIDGDPRDCDDGTPCTTDSCSEDIMMCVATPLDADGDGAPARIADGRRCEGGTDCNDSDPGVRPGADELCNGDDDDCDGTTDESCVALPDTCSTARAITLSASGTATITGRLEAFEADYGNPCSRAGAPDAVYYLDITRASDVTIDTIGSVADTVIAVGTTCSSTGFRLGCDNDYDSGVTTESRVWVHRIAPEAGSVSRRLFILVDGFEPASIEDFTLNVRVTDAAPDTCRMGPIDIDGGGSLVGFVTTPAIVPVTEFGSCQAMGDRSLTEAIATFTGSESGEMQSTTYSDAFDPDVYLRESPCGTGMELTCVAGDGIGTAGYRFATSLSTTVTTGDPYFIFVDGVGAGGGSYFLSYEP